ncbi:MAG: carboxypeptidase-like regulatory domain-containing protein, partial [Bacteroidota bacterium]|nr:carboxypeptidase-like regulatory domain-containing protein [Bacteroidota bacterium]
MRHIFMLMLLGLGLASLSARGQQASNPLISGNFAHLRFEEFARQLEAQAPVRLYFDPRALDSLFVTLRVQATPLPAVLEEALRNTDFHFAVDDENRVFVVRGRTLNRLLPGDFFDAAKEAEDLAATAGAAEPAATKGRAPNASEYQLSTIGAAGSTGSRATLAGRLRAHKTGEPVIGASIYSESTKIGASTDAFGGYSLTLPVGRHELKIRGVGIKNTRRLVLLRGDGKLDIDVEEDIVSLREVIVEAEKDKNVAGLEMGVQKLDIKTMRQVPTVFGETDILRVILTLPGVK